MNNLGGPRCGLSHIKKNGHTHYGKQNHQCLNCGRQFVRDAQRIAGATRALVKSLLLERLSLRAICRVVGISLIWLLQFIAEVYDHLPDDLGVRPGSGRRGIHLLRLEAEVDELWSFAGNQANQQWLSLAFDKETRQVLAFFVGERQPRASCGSASRAPTGSGLLSTATTGRRTRASSQPVSIRAAARSRG